MSVSPSSGESDRDPCRCAACATADGTGRGRHQLARRRLLKVTAAGLAAGLLAEFGAGLWGPRAARAQTILTPEAALQELLEGNRRFVGRHLVSFEQDLAKLRSATVEKQEPFAALLSCADSRVPVELVFDQSIGRIFVARVAGNIATPEIIASLEYGAAVLGTRVMMVLGHGGCGAVKAALEAKAAPGQISALYAAIRPAVEQAGPSLDAAIRANARRQADLLRHASPVIAGLVKGGRLKVLAAHYDLASGVVTLLD